MGRGYNLWMGICNNINLIKLLQPNWTYTRIEINDAQDELNMQEGKCEENRYLVWCFMKRNGFYLVLSLIRAF